MTKSRTVNTVAATNARIVTGVRKRAIRTADQLELLDDLMLTELARCLIEEIDRRNQLTREG